MFPFRRRPARRANLLITLALTLTVGVGLTSVQSGDSGLAQASAGASEPDRRTAPRSAAAGTASLSGWLHTSGNQIVDADGRPYRVKGVSWFGMEIDTCAPHGLWQIPMNTALSRIKNSGFNTVRLPYSNDCLRKKKPTSIDFAKNGHLRGKSALQVMDATIARARAHGLNVILDRHRPTSPAMSELWYTRKVSEKRWIADWKMLAKRYKNNSTVIGFDLHNEPNGRSCWGCGKAKFDWAAAATRAGNAVHTVNPKLLIIVEGVEHQGNGEETWWGGGLADVRNHPIVLKVEDRVVYSPHDYPASIWHRPWFDTGNYPRNLPAQWEKTWGFIHTEQIAPVLLGEFGTNMHSKSDRQWLATMVTYLDERNMSFAWWAYNANSGDTGGIVKGDWRTPEKGKLRALAPLLRN